MALAMTLIKVLVALHSILSTASCGRIMVGGKTEMTDLKTNKEVQELGRFAVEEFNKGPRLWQNGIVEDRKLAFEEVVEEPHQVVSGMKYYMKILTTQDGVRRMLTSVVVVVKPWLHSKKLLNFKPSSTTSFQ